MYKLNTTLRRNTVRILGAVPKDAAWKLRAEHRSPRWTTRWDELPKVKAKRDLAEAALNVTRLESVVKGGVR
jgi:hypothetical protein